MIGTTSLTFLWNPLPAIDCEQGREGDHSDAEFADEVVGVASVARDGIEVTLDEGVVGGVENDSGPEAARLHPDPCEGYAGADDHEGEAEDLVGPRSVRRRIWASDDERDVPDGPDDAADDGGFAEADPPGEFGDEEASPAAFFAGRVDETEWDVHGTHEREIS